MKQNTGVLGWMFGLLLALAGPATLASPIVFDAFGTLANGTSMGGTVTVDVATGAVLQSNLTFAQVPNQVFSDIGTAQPVSGFFDFNVNDALGDRFSSGLAAATLINYLGSNFCSSNAPCNFGATSALIVGANLFRLTSGYLTPQIIKVFNASGVLGNGSTLGGTVTIDVVRGTVLQSNLTFSQVPGQVFSDIGTAQPVSGFFDFNVNDALGDRFSSGLGTPSLVDYLGGTFCSTTTVCNFGATSALIVGANLFRLTSGSLSLPETTVSVPEPPSIALIGIALLSFAMGRRRKLQ